MEEPEAVIPHNYGTHFCEWWQTRRSVISQAEPAAARLFQFATQLLAQAQYFLLPLNGRLLDDLGRFDAKYAPLLHLPFPVTAFEYRALDPLRRQAPREALCSKRIALCFEPAAAQSLKLPEALAEDEWLLLSIFYIDQMKVWCVYPALSVISRSRTLQLTDEDVRDSQTLIEEIERGGIAEPGKFQAMQRGLHMLEVRFLRLQGSERLTDAEITTDTRDEIAAAIQACAALSCQNVDTRTVAPSEALNRKRLRGGKPPMVSYHVLELTHDERGGSLAHGGTHATPRQHLRRGHIRRLSTSRTTWVRSCVVGSRAQGEVHKDYHLTEAPPRRV